MENNFDFNKLFKEGIGFHRLCEKEAVLAKCRLKVKNQLANQRHHSKLCDKSLK